jgi:hypothetical protein
MVPSSCEFNSIEWLWSLVKLKFRKIVTSRVGQIRSQEQLDQVVIEAIESIDDEQV